MGLNALLLVVQWRMNKSTPPFLSIFLRDVVEYKDDLIHAREMDLSGLNSKR